MSATFIGNTIDKNMKTLSYKKIDIQKDFQKCTCK